MTICTICCNAVVALYPRIDELEPQLSTQATYPSYDAAAVQNCWICAKFADWLNVDDDEAWQAWLQGPLTNVFRPGMCTLIGDGSSDPSSVDVEEDLPADSIGRRNLRISSMFVWRCIDDEEDGCEIQLNFLRDTDFQGPDMYVNQRSPPGVDIERVHEWIKECERDHENCVLPHQVWYPTRLLDLGKPGAIMKLIIAKETSPAGPYMTLSHRWGKHIYKQLTSRSENRFQTSIDISTLPRVFQDAIDITRNLKVRYLWIDSLCIKQDQECGDWEAEALQMGNVYAHSYLNLSASHATEGSDPALFSPKPWGDSYLFQLKVECEGPLKKDYVADGDVWLDEVLEAPLMNRGWVFQERFLAPRVLHFGKRQMAWECNCLSAVEIFPRGLPECLRPASSKQQEYSLVTRPKDITAWGSFHGGWRRLVSRYSACSFTFPSDRAAAFADVAKMIGTRYQDEYIAGAWKSTLLIDLAWFLTEYGKNLTPVSNTAPCGPSWSWLSLYGEIGFYPETSWADELTMFAIVLDMPGSDRVGNSESIRLKGLLLQVEDVTYISENSAREFTVYGSEFEQGPSPESTRLDSDRPMSDIRRLIRDGNLWLVPLYASQGAIVSILISATDRAGDYRRVGAAQIQYLEFPHKSIMRHLDGWKLVNEGTAVAHDVAANLCRDIIDGLDDGEDDVFNLI